MEQTKRIYSLSDADLIQLADSFYDIIIGRDKPQFLLRGYNEARYNVFFDAIETFRRIPSDDAVLLEQQIATANKDQTRGELEKLINLIKSMAAVHYPSKSPKAQYFQVKTYGISDAQLLRDTRTLISVTEQNFSDLETEGLTVETMNRFKVTCDLLDVLIDRKNAASRNRDSATQERINAGNAVYELVSKIAITGQSIWDIEGDEARYNDYIISTKVNNGSFTEKEFTIEAGKQMAIYDKVLNTDLYTVTNFSNHRVLVYFAEVKEFPVTPEVAEVLPALSTSTYQTAPQNLYILVKNEFAEPADINLKIDKIV